jgi:hypothetical protein
MAVRTAQRRRVLDLKLLYRHQLAVPHSADSAAGLWLVEWWGAGGGLRRPGEILDRRRQSHVCNQNMSDLRIILANMTCVQHTD